MTLPISKATTDPFERDFHVFAGRHGRRLAKRVLQKREIQAQSLRPDIGLSLIGFNIAAFLLGWVWFLFRKMWLAAALYLIVFLMIGILVNRVAPDLARSAAIGLAVCAALFHDWIYLQHARQKIAAIDRDNLSPEARYAAIRAAGGVSWIAFAIGLMVFLTGLTLSVWAHFYIRDLNQTAF